MQPGWLEEQLGAVVERLVALGRTQTRIQAVALVKALAREVFGRFVAHVPVNLALNGLPLIQVVLASRLGGVQVHLFLAECNVFLTGTIHAKIKRIILLCHQRNGAEQVIKDNTELRRNTPSVKIENKGNVTGVARTEANKDAAMRVRLPAWKFMALLEWRVKNKHWTTPDMKIAKFMARNLGASKDISRSNAKIVGKVIGDMGGKFTAIGQSELLMPCLEHMVA